MRLIGHVINNPGAYSKQQGAMFDYVLGAGGLFVRAKREYLEVTFPIANTKVRGLDPIIESFYFTCPPVPVKLADEILQISSKYAEQSLETLFHLTWSPVYPWNRGWELIEPEQERSRYACKPIHDGPGSTHERAIIEIHSHGSEGAYFSSQDDIEEQGFRLYGVIGRLLSKPVIRIRVGCYGYFWDIPASLVITMPKGLLDCNDLEPGIE